MLGPTGRIRSEDRRWPKAAKHFRPGASLLPLVFASILQHTGVEPFLDQPHDAPICNPVFDEFHKPFVGKPIEEALDIQVEHPVHFSRQQSRVERVQRLMLAAPGSEPVREAEKIRLVDGVQYLHRRTLDDLVFQRRYSERSLPARRPSDLNTLRTGFARYAPRFSLSERSWRFPSSSSP